MGLSWTFGLTFYDIIAPKTSKNIHVWISRLAHAPNHFCYPSWDIVNLWVINKFNQHRGSLWSPNRLLTLSTSHISQFNKPQISVLPNLPSPFHPPTSNLKSLANCWPRQLSLQRSLWSSDILYKYPWVFPGWHRTPLGSLAAILPQRGRVKKNLMIGWRKRYL